MYSSLNLVQQIVVWAIPILFAITLHEVAHGWAARYLGDSTAARQGRLSLNPIRHVDPIGTVALPALLMLFHSGFIFGWAKPVPVDGRNLKHPLRDMAIVAAAGPLSNFAMAVIWGVAMKCTVTAAPAGGALEFFQMMCRAGVMMNLGLMALNLLPLPPLDGSKVLMGFLPPHAAYQYSKIEPYGFVILVVMMYFHVLGAVLMPIYAACAGLLNLVLGG